MAPFLRSIDYLKSPNYSPKIRWIDDKYFLAKDMLQEGKIIITHIPGKDNPVDALTKPLREYDFNRFVERLGLKGRNE
ncbi:uncharacterized protein ASPGLDRAFT_62457 [Aspergillus glaucus CBS 516.65]|uniref:Uncharacterized protein n=1 Tax=Aspergillus glaucus CBS 516.65 TaxID=1160497 RepID=A0A1L9V3P6_ASPGL|nr:hypothetical protein ASPGLDRAFT_62457 [Aspergillus glaucus CBS 516.65]OJJ78548.1 hypothetical protein ASPGLDRAFT_62457 [Aspergillus glaucus CBS 516.65]